MIARHTITTALAAIAAIAVSASAQRTGLIQGRERSAEAAVRPGTLIPVSLDSAISTTSSKPEEAIRARVTQDVLIGAGSVIRAGTPVIGHIVDVIPASTGEGARIIVKFDAVRLSKGAIPLTTTLRALASPVEVEDAQIPTSGPDAGTPSTAWTTVQVGGEAVYRGGGHVMDGETVVGEPVYNGALGSVRANRDRGCPGLINANAEPQALWIFSSDACGTYGLPNLRIAHAGRTKPIGEVILTASSGDLKIRSGSGLLLRVVTAAPERNSR